MGKRGQLPECAISALAVFSSLSAALPATGNDATAKLPFHLIKDGKATATVVMSKVPPEDAYDIVKAIDLFRHDVARFGIPTGDWIDIPVNNRLYRGRRPKTNRIELVVEKRPLETEDDTVIDFPEEQVMRITGGRSGVIRALFYLLEEFGGVRYLGQGGAAPSHFPSIRELAVPQKRIERRAVFPLSRTTGQSTYAIDCPRRRPYFWGWEAKLGAKARIDARGHSLDKIAFPIEEYARRKQKPPGEIFPILHGERYLPYEKNLRYSCNGWQPCFTSEAAVDEAATNILAFLRTFPRTTSIKLNVNDCGNHCECEKCLAVDQGGKVRNMLGYVDRSESYYLWANRLAERVCKEFPDVYFTCIAYREVYEPPSLKLHPRIAVTLLFDLSSWADPEVTKERKELMRRWARKCDLLGFGGYDWGCFCYSLPRVYFREQQEAIRALRDHHGVTLTSSRSYLTMNEGPKMYLYFKLQENPDLDLEETIGDWCRACVGEAAAPYLRQYYAFWEDFWRTKATKTFWWETRRRIYMKYGLFASYLYGLEEGDLDHCRKLMEKVVELADAHGTDDQKARAATQMSCFEWSEAAAKACGAELFSPDATLPAGEAVAMVRHIPEACRSFERWKEIPGKTPDWYDAGLILRKTLGRNPVSNILPRLGRFLDDPAVREELAALSRNQAVPANLRRIAGTMLKSIAGDRAGNLLANGSFEEDGTAGWKTESPRHGKVSVVETVAAAGKRSLKCEIQHGNFTIKKLILEAKPDTEYYFSARIFLPPDQASLEGRVQIWGIASYDRGKKNTEWSKGPELMLNSGEWNTVNTIVPPDPRTDSTKLFIRLGSFEDGDVAYVDDVQLIEIPKHE